MTLKALIFDVDGTLAETEECHRAAFNETFVEFGINWHWDIELYTELLEVAGGKERIKYHAERISYGDIDAAKLHARKTEIYGEKVRIGALVLRDGVEALIRKAKKSGLLLAIATTTSRVNVDSLLTSTLGAASLDWFDAICCGNEVAVKKPHPAIYQLALERLALSPSECLVFEDTHIGLMSALGAGLDVVITPGIYSVTQDFTGATLILDDLAKPFSYKGFDNTGV